MIRTRIAPSPTGDPHVGTGYIALFNYCLAQKLGGEFILRIEDTDQVRSTKESEEKILSSLKWMGLEWSEGPDVGGPHGPYRQSERSEIYKEHCDILLKDDHAFRCFCTSERLTEVRNQQREAKGFLGYDGHCISISAEESEKRSKDEDFVVRMKVPREGICIVEDHFRDDIEFEWATVDMQVLMKSDGLPTYHLANVVDDHLMKITHVMRGEEWITSAPKHLLLYKYFGWEAPKLLHLPLLRNPDKSKLSKRKNPTSISYYERAGFLPEALVNYLGMMAFSMPEEKEKFTLSEMVEAFDLERISMGGPVFDVDKLTWLNGRYIREDLDVKAFAKRIQDWALNEDYLMKIAPLVQQRVDTLGDLGFLSAFFFANEVNPSAEDLKASSKKDDDVLLRIFQFGLWRLEALKTWKSEAIQEVFKTLATEMDLKIRDVVKPYFVAISGSASSTPLFDSMEVLGPDLSRVRVRKAIDALGGVSKKAAKRLEKEYRTLASD